MPRPRRRGPGEAVSCRSPRALPGCAHPFEPNTEPAMSRPVALLLASAITMSFTGCKPAPAPNANPDAAATSAAATDTKQADAKFADLSKRWLDGYMKLSPVSATSIGDHRF